MLRLALTMVLALILSLAGIPANALAEETFDADAEEFATEGQKLFEEFAVSLYGTDDPLVALWDYLTAVDVVEDTTDVPDVEAAAQDALNGSPSTPEGINHAFVAVAQLLGYDVWEVVADQGLPVAAMNVDGEELTFNVAQGECGVYPWQYDETETEDAEEVEQTEEKCCLTLKKTRRQVKSLPIRNPRMWRPIVQKIKKCCPWSRSL